MDSFYLFKENLAGFICFMVCEELIISAFGRFIMVAYTLRKKAVSFARLSILGI